MKLLFKNNRGAAAVEFALGIMPIMVFMVGIMMTAYVLWIDNMLYFAVDYAARCGAVQSNTTPPNTTPPCYGPGLANMKRTADALFLVSGATYALNSSTCSSGSGLKGTYRVNIALFTNLTLTANSCYPQSS
jgi:Flp pilus assembly protein TadG